MSKTYGAIQKLFAVSFLFFSISCTTAPPTDYSTLITAIDEQDYDTLLALSTSENGDKVQTSFAQAMVLSMLNQLDVAEEKLGLIIDAQNSPALTARAMRALSGVYVRQDRYADVVDIMQQIAAFDGAPDVTVDEQTVGFFTALQGNAPMQFNTAAASVLPAMRDKANLVRIDVSVNGVGSDAIFDTGAAYTTVSFTAAQSMNLRPLGVDVEVGGSTNAVVTTGLAFADELRIGNAVFNNVLVIVAPDEALSFPAHDYYVSMILGYPLINKLGVVEFIRNDSGENVRFSPSAAPLREDNVNLIFSGWQPVVLAEIAGADQRIRLFLDTGARTSSLYNLIGDAVPGLLSDDAEQSVSTVGGFGGDVVEEESLTINNVNMELGEKKVLLPSIKVIEDDGSNRHGVLGQDILSQYSNVKFDFKAMTLSVENNNGED